MAEAKIFSDKNRTDVKIAHEDFVDKFLWRQLCKIVRERKNHGGVHAKSGKTVETLLSGGDAQRGSLRAKNFLRKGIERQCGCHGVDFSSASDSGLQNGLVAEMYAIKIADGERAASA